MKALQFLKEEDLALCSQKEFDDFFEFKKIAPDEPFYVISITGSYASGKSTLLNHLFFGGNIVFDNDDRDGISTLTNGLKIHPGEIIDPETNQKKRLLLIDSEGLGGPKKDSLDVGALLTLRLLLISDVIIHNSSTSLQKTDLEHLTNASHRLYEKRKEKKPRVILFFIQRTSLKYEGKKDLLKFFPEDTIPNWYPEVDLSSSPDKILVPKPDGTRLNLDDLQKKMLESMKKEPSMTSKELWSMMSHLDASLPKPNPDQLVKDGWDNCEITCFYCRQVCDESRFDPKHQHVCESRECTSNEKVTHKCRRCILEGKKKAESNAISSQTLSESLYGNKWECPDHGFLSYDFTWNMRPPFIHKSEQLEKTIIPYREHHFSKTAYVPEKPNGQFLHQSVHFLSEHTSKIIPLVSGLLSLAFLPSFFPSPAITKGFKSVLIYGLRAMAHTYFK